VLLERVLAAGRRGLANRPTTWTTWAPMVAETTKAAGGPAPGPDMIGSALGHS
jgi:hypothetical protein